jgi:O-antigen ligase/tetratricopeptide (TPR) repeat protein
MTSKQPNPNPSKSKALAYFEYVLLALCVAVIALRATVTEGPITHSATFAANVSDNLYSLAISTILMAAFVSWIMWNIFSKGFVYRLTGIEIGLGIFCIGAVVAGFAAADKRIAITDIAVFLAPAVMALLLVQILDSQAKIKLMLAVIAALGVVSAYQCADQFFFSNQMTIEQYQQNPQSVLGPLGIEPGTFQQFLFEHRLYSRGVRGFFTTRNSAASFALMALFAAVALFIDKLKNRQPDKSSLWYLFACGFGAVIILFSLGLTRSKGAVIGLFFAAAAFFMLLLFGNWLRAHKRAVLAVCVLLVVAGVCAVAWYGLSYGRLPGGGSMLVRWQYWYASAKMYASHPLTGIGPGNFGDFYTRYKPAAALESVADPHDFALSILTQYGPLGLLGFLAMLFVPLWRITANSAATSKRLSPLRPAFRRQAVIFLVAAAATLLLIRPLVLMPEAPSWTPAVIVYVAVTMYFGPVAAFVIAFVFFAGPLHKKEGSKSGITSRNTAIALFCAVLGVAVQNLFDFAIFEPGVLTAFWIMMACLISMDSQTKSRPVLSFKPAPFVRGLAVASVVAAGWAYLSYVFVPVAATTFLIRQANAAMSTGRLEPAHQLLEQAAGDDSLSASALSLNGRLYLQQYEASPVRDRDLLLRAESCLKRAIGRDDVPFNNFERLTDTYRKLAETSTGQAKADWLGKALEASAQAVKRYPGCARLHFKEAQIADQMGKTKIAIAGYRKAIEIEDAYRRQFKQIYPEQEDIVSRLDENMYLYSKDRVEELTKKSGD